MLTLLGSLIIALIQIQWFTRIRFNGSPEFETYSVSWSLKCFGYRISALRSPYPRPGCLADINQWPRVLLQRACDFWGQGCVKRQLGDSAYSWWWFIFFQCSIPSSKVEVKYCTSKCTIILLYFTVTVICPRKSEVASSQLGQRHWVLQGGNQHNPISNCRTLWDSSRHLLWSHGVPAIFKTFLIYFASILTIGTNLFVISYLTPLLNNSKIGPRWRKTELARPFSKSTSRPHASVGTSLTCWSPSLKRRGPHRSWNWQTIFGVKTIVGSNLTNKLCFTYLLWGIFLERQHVYLSFGPNRFEVQTFHWQRFSLSGGCSVHFAFTEPGWSIKVFFYFWGVPKTEQLAFGPGCFTF